MSGPQEHSVIFSAPMIRAILAGEKTQTRRIVRAPKCATLHGRRSYDDKHFVDPGGMFTPKGEQYLHWAYGGGDHGKDVLYDRVYSPYGSIGDYLWVREKWCVASAWYPASPYAYAADYDEHEYREHHRECRYEKTGRKKFDCMACHFIRWVSPIYMPRAAARITLEITGIRVERIQSISENDAQAEGMSGRASFEVSWNKINGHRATWESNPLVWAMSFRRRLVDARAIPKEHRNRRRSAG